MHNISGYRFSEPSIIPIVSPTERIKRTEREDVISFAGGLPAPELFPIDEINKMNQVVLQEAGAKALQYTTTEGYYPLREWIAKRMNERLGTSFDKDNILITHGSQQGLDLSGKVFLDDGDIVLCESPTYLAAISAFKSYKADSSASFFRLSKLHVFPVGF